MCYFNKKITELDTPELILDIDILENNIKRVAEKCKKLNIKLRPHIKTHKIPAIAYKQLDAGAVGIAVAKLGEAEVMEASGIKDIIVDNQIIGEDKIKRLINLRKRINISCLVDSFEGAIELSKIADRENVSQGVYIEINIGMNRCGVNSIGEAVKLAKKVKSLPKLNLLGILGFRSVFFKSIPKYTKKDIDKIGLEEGNLLIKYANSIRNSGIEIKEVIAGSTPTWDSSGSVSGITEVQPGTYVFNDIMQVSVGACKLEDCAVSVLTTVVSKPTSNRAIIDAGSKTLVGNCGSDCFPSIVEGHGLVKNKKGVILKGFSEEHGELKLEPENDIKIGDKLEIIPNHICPVVNMFDELVGIRNGLVEVIWPILARGRIK